ncbi:MAG: hypothetical protein ACP5EP_11400 [Acidobacteriaceae bacterium]
MQTHARGVLIVKTGIFIALLLQVTFLLAQATKQTPRSWIQDVRIGAYGLTVNNAAEIIRNANKSGVYGIEVDNDIPGRYESFLDPASKLQAIRKVAKLAHQNGNHAFVYIAGLECITANADASQHSMAKDHPDWLQRKRSGDPAIFTEHAAFWIKKGDEDVWISPYATEWRKIYMQRVRQIAATGIDGIYVDIPYWMTHFTGWEDSWASFDDYTVAAFLGRTGLDARKDIRPGDFTDPGFRKWVDFRIQTITDFLAEVRMNAISVNQNIAVIPEIYPGIEESAVRVGADVYQIYPVVDAIAHEYEFGEGKDHTAATRSQYDWFMYQIGMQSFRAFAGNKPTWMLNYSWDGAPRVTPSDAMKDLAMSELMAGANFWDAPGHSMAGSNDMATRRQIFHWIAKNQKQFSTPRDPVGDIGVYFSDSTRNYFPDEFVRSYQGALLLLLRQHIQFQIVTPRTLASYHGRTLVLPNVRVLDDEELEHLRHFSSTGGKIVITGNKDDRVSSLPNVTSFVDDPGKQYLALANKDFAGASPDTQSTFLESLKGPSEFPVQAPDDMVVYIATVDHQDHWFFADFKGPKKGAATAPKPDRNVVVFAPLRDGTKLHFLPFLGTPKTITGTISDGRVRFIVPEIDRGAVAWTGLYAPIHRPIKTRPY